MELKEVWAVLEVLEISDLNFCETKLFKNKNIAIQTIGITIISALRCLTEEQRKIWWIDRELLTLEL